MNWLKKDRQHHQFSLLTFGEPDIAEKYINLKQEICNFKTNCICVEPKVFSR